MRKLPAHETVPSDRLPTVVKAVIELDPIEQQLSDQVPTTTLQVLIFLIACTRASSSFVVV
jgi:hypothetical protein